MGSKYKVKKEDLRALFATVDMMMEGNYHEYYQKLGWKKTKSGNFECWNIAGHRDGKDQHPSLSVDARKGVYHCFTCAVRGNFQSYWKEYLKGGSGGDSYTDFIVDFLGLASGGKLRFSSSANDPDYDKNMAELKALSKNLEQEKFEKNGNRWIMSPELTNIIKEETTIPMTVLDGMVDALLKDEEALKYLFETRRITPEIVKKYRLGLTDRGKFIFPMINAEGNLLNMKAYDPRGPVNYKWTFPYKGHETCPTPIDHFTHQVLNFFAGEPDCYCAIAMGIKGAVTLGSEAVTDVDKVFGVDRARQIFGGKEINIILDVDETGIKAAKNLAESLYPYAKQIKIINLDKSEINPHGLDPDNVTEITAGDKTKWKRNEKDFTDFMRKREFSDSANVFFSDLIKNTTVYTHNIDRISKEVFKVTLQECRMPKYYSCDGSKVLELIASVSEFNSQAYQYPKIFKAVCSMMDTPKDVDGACTKCSVATHPAFGIAPQVYFHLSREIPKEHMNDRSWVQIHENDILGLIEVNKLQKDSYLKRITQINDTCKKCFVSDVDHEKLLHIQLTKDVNEYSGNSDSASVGVADIDVDAYMVLKDIYPNKSYKFEAVQALSWKSQEAVLFAHKAEPVATCIETFTMDQQMHEILSIFKQRPGEIIADTLRRRYDAFAGACGAIGRHDVFFLNDLAFFSPLELSCKILPGIKRGWVEVLICGDTRTCKTMITKWLFNHYKVGDMVSGSSAVTRSGLIGGMQKNSGGNKFQVAWGKIPMNDGGLLIIDEMGNIDEKHLSDLTGCRSDGIADVTGIVTRQVLARVRKIMISNQRAWTSDRETYETDGMTFIKKLCMKDEILARFDAAFVVRRDDVDIEKITTSFEKACVEFTEYQCQNHIRWAHSRKASDVIYTDEFCDAVNNAFITLLKKYHSSTQLVNQEIRAKLVRMSISLATILYSTPEDDWNKILVTKDHLNYVVEYINRLYCSKNMGLDKYSDRIRQHEQLGDMRFMECIAKYVDLNQLLRYDEFTEKHLQQIFCDYLEQVQARTLYMVDLSDDNKFTSGQMPYISVPKLIGTLQARNCLERSRKGGYGKTKQFSEWLAKRQELGANATFSDFLEGVEDKQNPDVSEAARGSRMANGEAQVRRLPLVRCKR